MPPLSTFGDGDGDVDMSPDHMAMVDDALGLLAAGGDEGDAFGLVEDAGADAVDDIFGDLVPLEAMPAAGAAAGDIVAVGPAADIITGNDLVSPVALAIANELVNRRSFAESGAASKCVALTSFDHAGCQELIRIGCAEEQVDLLGERTLALRLDAISISGQQKASNPRHVANIAHPSKDRSFAKFGKLELVF